MRRVALLPLIALITVSAHAHAGKEFKTTWNEVLVRALRASSSSVIAESHLFQRLQEIDRNPGLDKWLRENPDALDYLSQRLDLNPSIRGAICRRTRTLGNDALKKAAFDAVRDAQQIAEQARARNKPDELQRLRKRRIDVYLPDSELRAFFMPNASIEAAEIDSKHIFDGSASQNSPPVVAAPANGIINGSPPQHSRLVAASESPMKEVFSWINRVAPYHQVPILILGESGTGKELVARALHGNGPAAGKFIPVNCANLTQDLMGSELFGHMAGSFTGATWSKGGLIEEAAHGTLFLDEIGEMDLRLQARLLRVLNGDYSENRRVGSNESTPVAARIMAATNKNPQQLIENGVLREDLFYRLNLAPITIPSLRERRGDIPLLIEYFLSRAQAEFKKIVDLSPAEIEELKAKDWPGNVRELENAIKRKVLMDGKPSQPPSAVVFPSASNHNGNGQLPLKEVAANAEREGIQSALRNHGGNKQDAAEELGVSVATLYRKMAVHGITQ